MQNAERIAQQQKANRFWETHFEDLLETPITEQVALEINLWQRLKEAFATQDKDHCKLLHSLTLRIIRLAKHAIDASDRDSPK